MQRDFKSASFLAIMLFMSISLFAQPKVNDPYTILGLGNLNNLNFAGLSAMPGLTATYHDIYQMNIQNPASSSFLSQTAFEAGGYYEFKIMETPNESDRVNTGNLSYLALGFPLFNSLNKLNERKKRPYNLGMTISLTPYSNVGYDLVQRDSVAGVGNIESTFEGNGGTYKFLWGNSFRYKNVSIGANIGYLFGKQTSEHWDYLLDVENEYRNRFLAETNMNGFIWNVGGLYEILLPQEKEYDKNGKAIKKPRTRITLGVYGNSKNNISTSTNFANERRQTLNGSLVDVDSIISSATEVSEGKITLPAEVGAGIMFSRDGNWKIGMDYTYSGWSKYTNDLDSEMLNNSFRIGFGAEILPKYDAPFRQYRKRITYRLGGFYKTDPRVIEGSGSFTQKAVTFGVGLPLQPDLDNRKLVSFVNLSAEIGQYGDAEFLKETYFKLTLGFTLNDNLWFYKSKYN